MAFNFRIKVFCEKCDKEFLICEDPKQTKLLSPVENDDRGFLLQVTVMPCVCASPAGVLEKTAEIQRLLEAINRGVVT